MSDTDRDNLPDEPSGEGVTIAPWEKRFERIISPIEEFIHRQTTTSLLLMLATAIALILANSPYVDIYQNMREVYAGISLDGIGFTMAIFIAELGFVLSNNLFMAKMGILIASLVAGISGYIWLYLSSAKPQTSPETAQQPVA